MSNVKSFVSKRISERLSVQELIGKGANGEVYAATLAPLPPAKPEIFQNRALVAKRLRRHRTETREARFLTTHGILKNINHPNVAKITHVEVHSNSYWTVMERCFGCDVIDHVVDNSPGSLSKRLIKRVMFQLLQAVQCLHANDLVHCDVKLDNIRFKTSPDEKDFEVCLFDFDDCQFAKPIKETGMPVGTLQYLAPEILRGYHSTARDMWSIGVTMYVMMEGYFPWDVRPAQEASSSSVRWEQLGKIFKSNPAFDSSTWKNDREATDLIQGMLCRDPLTRLTACQALQHSWFDDLYLEAQTAGDSTATTPMFCDASAFQQISADVRKTNDTQELKRLGKTSAAPITEAPFVLP